MSAVNATVPSGTRAGGLAVMAGMVLTLVASLFFPGGPIIDPVDQTDFPAAVRRFGCQSYIGARDDVAGDRGHVTLQLWFR